MTYGFVSAPHVRFDIWDVVDATYVQSCTTASQVSACLQPECTCRKRNFFDIPETHQYLAGGFLRSRCGNLSCLLNRQLTPQHLRKI